MRTLHLNVDSLGRREIVLWPAFILLASIAYWPSVFGQPIWDDHSLIGSNPFFRSPILAFESFKHWLFPLSVSTYYRPVQNLSYIVDYWYWGSNLAGFHFTNIVLHGTAALLIGRLLLRLGPSFPGRPFGENELVLTRWVAWSVACIWLVHPIHHAGVAYISGRADSLAAVLAVGAWLCAAWGLSHGRDTWRVLAYLLAAVLGWLALCSKEIAICWFALFIIFYLFFSPSVSRRERMALVAGCCVIFLIYYFQRSAVPLPFGSEAASPVGPMPLRERLLLALKALGDYVTLVGCPLNLHMERNLLPPETSGGRWVQFHHVLLLPVGALTLIVSGVLFVYRHARRAFRRFAIVWFFVGFLPISNLFPLNAQVAEHWIYMPSIGLILLAAGEANAILRHLPLHRTAGVILTAAVLIMLTHRQSRTWVDEEMFFKTTIQRGGDSIRVRSNLARVLQEQGRLSEAEAVAREALARHPNAPIMRIRLADILRRQGRDREAAEIVGFDEERFKRPTERPGLQEAMLIDALLASGQDAFAWKVLDGALGRHPHVWRLVRTRAMLLQRAGEQGLVIKTIEDYLHKNWWHPEPVLFLAQHLAAAGRFEEAIEKYELVARLDIRSFKPWEQIAAIRFSQGRVNEALEAQQKAVRCAPDSAVQRLKLAQAHEALGHTREAENERAIARACSLRESGANPKPSARHSEEGDS